MNRFKFTKKLLAIVLAGSMTVAMCACSSTDTDTSDTSSETTTTTEAVSSDASDYLSADDITVETEYSSESDSEHAIENDGEEQSYTNIGVTKTGDSDSGDEADFYGDNSAVFTTNGGTTTIDGALIETNGTHANAVFSYGEGTTVNISNSVITTEGNCSGGLMTTGGGTMNAENLTINTSGNSSAAIRSDRGGGTVTVTEGYYKTTGTGSPVIYSTADITVNDSYMESTASQGVVVEGQNSVTLNNDVLVADNNTKNSDNSDYYQAVMIYQSMSGDADEGLSSFTATGGSITNKNGDIFFVTNTACDINLTGVTITNEDSDGVFLRECAAGWGSDGSNGGHANLNASGQTIEGDMLVDEDSTLNLYLKDSSSFTGAINPDGQSGDVYVEIESGSTWTLTADSYVSELTVEDGASIDLNGYTLYVDGEEYTEGSTSEGSAFEVAIQSSGNGGGGDMPSGEAPDGNGQGGPGGDGGSAPDGNGGGPGGNGGNGGEPPEKPDGSN